MKTESSNNSSWISKKPGRCGGRACVRDTRMPVWSVIKYRLLGDGWGDILLAYPTLTEGDLEAAWGYYQDNKDEIDSDIRKNEEAACEGGTS